MFYLLLFFAASSMSLYLDACMTESNKPQHMGRLLFLLSTGSPQPEHPQRRLHLQHFHYWLLFLGPYSRPHDPLHWPLQMAGPSGRSGFSDFHRTNDILPTPRHKHQSYRVDSDFYGFFWRYTGYDGAIGCYVCGST